MVSENNFRQDLLYRINTVEIKLPPLRERPEDIPDLANYFLKSYARKYQKPELKFGSGTMKTLQDYT
ncbi:MAG: sigma-54-dependent Fis family transcriptional regulator, partial [Saprospiraceae bacterium]|nr:sigma-54-dependent Fis family transcriptional regulator [Saprospiraceae bacterium]